MLPVYTTRWETVIADYFIDSDLALQSQDLISIQKWNTDRREIGTHCSIPGALRMQTTKKQTFRAVLRMKM